MGFNSRNKTPGFVASVQLLCYQRQNFGGLFALTLCMATLNYPALGEGAVALAADLEHLSGSDEAAPEKIAAIQFQKI